MFLVGKMRKVGGWPLNGQYEKQSDLGRSGEAWFLRMEAQHLRCQFTSAVDVYLFEYIPQMILYGLASWKWGADQRDFAFPISDFDIVNLGPAVLSYLNIATLLITLILMFILFLFFRYTKVGIAMKATQQNATAARINGIRTNRILSITWALSSLIGAVAGILLAPIATLDPNLMLEPLLKGFASAVLGGMTTLVGAALGGYMLGIIENLFGGYVSLEFKSIVAFGIIVLVLCFRPSGLFGRHYVRKV